MHVLTGHKLFHIAKHAACGEAIGMRRERRTKSTCRKSQAPAKLMLWLSFCHQEFLALCSPTVKGAFSPVA